MKQNKKVSINVVSDELSTRAGYKRKGNRRVDVLGDQLKRLARKSMNRHGAKSFRNH